MPGPTTEILNEDIKLIQSDLKQVEITLARHGVMLRVIIAGFSLLIAITISGIAAGIFWAGKMTDDVQYLKSDVIEIKQMIRELAQSKAVAGTAVTPKG
jgi:hypothetical protein